MNYWPSPIPSRNISQLPLASIILKLTVKTPQISHSFVKYQIAQPLL